MTWHESSGLFHLRWYDLSSFVVEMLFVVACYVSPWQILIKSGKQTGLMAYGDIDYELMTAQYCNELGDQRYT